MRKGKDSRIESLNPLSYHSSGVAMLTISVTMPSVSTIAPRNTCGVSISNPPKIVTNRARNATIFQYIVLPPIKFWFSSLLKMKIMRMRSRLCSEFLFLLEISRNVSDCKSVVGDFGGSNLPYHTKTQTPC